VFMFTSEDGKVLADAGHFGKTVDGVTQLSLIEASYLMDAGMLKVESVDGKKVSQEMLIETGKKGQEGFERRLTAYSDLRARGMVVKTGFKYGTHFRVYETSPNDCHARYLVHVLPSSKVLQWPEISRTVRLSGGVKKEILFCRSTDPIEYLEFRWFKP